MRKIFGMLVATENSAYRTAVGSLAQVLSMSLQPEPSVMQKFSAGL